MAGDISVANDAAQGLPCFVQVGFAGTRDLFGENDPVKRGQLEAQAVDLLGVELNQLRAEFDLSTQHYFCGVSQIAIGADMVFTEACAKRTDFLQRIFLPQHLEDYLHAGDTDGTRDFQEGEEQRARRLLTGSQIIEESVVARSADRDERFEEVNLEIARSSDLVICLTRKLSDAERKKKEENANNGGTGDLLNRALARGLTTLELEIEMVEDGQVVCSKRKWHNQQRLKDPESSARPVLPEDLHSVRIESGIPQVGAFLKAMEPLSGGAAELWKAWFSRAAGVIVGTHVVASLIAVGMLVFANTFSHPCLAGWLPWFVGGELVLLITGFATHLALHRSHAAQRWALNRLMDMINLSVHGVAGLHMSLSYLFDLELPQSLRPLLRTLNVLHLRSSRGADRQDWKSIRTNYLKRVAVQQKYYNASASSHRRKAQRDNVLFLLFSGTAIAIGAYKFFAHGLHLSEAEPGPWTKVFEIVGIIGPILAVGILSYSAAMDHEANAVTFRETRTRIDDLERQITAAKSRNEMERLVVETERVLLGENAAWFSRRTFKGVS